MVETVVLIVLGLVCLWLCSVHVAWAFRRRDLKAEYGRAPYNWRIAGWIFVYPEYLARLQREAAQNSTEEN